MIIISLDYLYSVYVDKKGFDKKPNIKQTSAIVSRVSQTKKQKYCWEEILEAIKNGKTMIFANLKAKQGKIKGARNQDFLNTRFLVLDFDNGFKIEEAINQAKEYNLKPALIYKTFSHTKKKHKFRMIFLFENNLNKDEFKYSWYVLNNLFDKKIDKSCKDLSRLYYSTDKEVYFQKENNEISFVENIQKVAYELSLIHFTNYSDFQEKIEIEDKNRKKSLEYYLSNEEQLNNALKKFYKIKTVNFFERGKWDKLDHEKVRSLMFCYYHLKIIKRFFKVIKKYWKNYPKYDLNYWQYQFKYAMQKGYDGHTHTKKILAKLNLVDYLDKNLKLYRGEKIKIEEQFITKEQFTKVLNDKSSFLLVTAPTGSGKTYSTIKSAQANKEKVIFLSPYYTTTRQVSQQYKAAGLYGQIRGEAITGEEELIVATYNKAERILKASNKLDLDEFTVVVDEAHNLISQYHFRKKAMKSVERLQQKAKKVIHITATPLGLSADYDKIFNFVKRKTFKKANIINTSKINIMLKQVEENRQSDKIDIIRIQSKEKQKIIRKYFIDRTIYTAQEILILNSDKKLEDDFEYLIKEEYIKKQYKLVISTSVIDDGVNIKNQKINNIYYFNDLDINALLQFPSRCRAGFNEMYIYNNLTNKKDFFDFKNMGDFLIRKEESKAKQANEELQSRESEIKFNPRQEQILKILTKNLNGNFLKFDKTNFKYKVDKRLIRSKVYQMINGRLKNSNLKEVLKRYICFEEIKFSHHKKPKIKIEQLEQKISDKDFEELLEHRYINIIIKTAINILKIKDIRKPKSSSRNADELRREYENLDYIIESRKKEFKKIIKFYDFLFKIGYTYSIKTIRTAIELFKTKHRYNLFRDKIAFVVAFELEDKLRPLEAKKIRSLKALEDKKLTIDEARKKISKIRGTETKQAFGFLKKFADIKITRPRTKGNKRTSAAEIKKIYTFDDLEKQFKLDLTALKKIKTLNDKNSFKEDIQNNSTKKMIRYIQDTLL